MRIAFLSLVLLLVPATGGAFAQDATARLRSELERIHDDDQRERESARRAAAGGQKDSVVRGLIVLDSLHLLRVTAILDSAGWLGKDVLGYTANQTLWLVLQHGDQSPDVQQAYLPMMREAVLAGKAQASELAMLEDRVEVNHGRPQIYGSQIGWKDGKPFVKPMVDEEHVNERRAAVGLEPLEKYTERFGFTWSPLVKQERVLFLGSPP